MSMEKSNTEKTVKNSLISVFSQIVALFLSFISRRIFVHYLDIEYLGYESLFSNIFRLLSVAELGIGNIIVFHLYEEMSTNNREEICKLMSIYQVIYRLVAFVVLISGGIVYFFLPYIIKNPTESWGYLHIIYILQLINIILGYFLSYKRTILIVDQREYYCVEIDLVFNIISLILRIIILALFKSFILYLIISIVCTVVSNLWIYRKVNIDYPYIKKHYHVTFADIRDRNMIKDISNLLIHKISYAIYGGTDNIIISAFCGIRDVALFGNYITIKSGVMQVLYYKLLNPIQATIGKIVHSDKDREYLWEQFKALDMFGFFFGCYIGLGFLIFYQQTISIWMGKQYLLPFPFVISLSLQGYLGATWEIVYKYRSVFGDFEKDRNCMVISAVLNIVSSIILCQYFGVTGVQIGTIIAFLPIAYGRIRFVVRDFFHKSIFYYLLKHVELLFLVIGEGTLICMILVNVPFTFYGFLIRGVVWAIVPLVINSLIFKNNNDYIEMKRYFRNVLTVIKNKIRIRKG